MKSEAGRTTKSFRRQVASELMMDVDEVTDLLLAKITDDDEFVYHLHLCKNDPELRALLLREVMASEPTEQASQSNIRLAATAASALARWAVAGFGQVDEAEHARRLAICAGCEHLSYPPAKALYKLVGSQHEKSVCGLCGCDVRRKAWLSTESCPDKTMEGGRWQTQP